MRLCVVDTAVQLRLKGIYSTRDRFSLLGLRNELYLISAALMVLLAILRKLFIGKILAVRRQEQAYCSRETVYMVGDVRRVWVLVKRSTCFSLQNEEKIQEHLLPA